MLHTSLTKVATLRSLVKLYLGKQAETQDEFETMHPKDPLQVWSCKKAEKILEFYHFLQRSILLRFPGSHQSMRNSQEHLIHMICQSELLFDLSRTYS